MSHSAPDETRSLVRFLTSAVAIRGTDYLLHASPPIKFGVGVDQDLHALYSCPHDAQNGEGHGCDETTRSHAHIEADPPIKVERFFKETGVARSTETN
jgi:hypothetical protein